MPVPFLFYRRHIGDFRRHKTFTIMLHEEVKLQLGKFLSETPLDFDDQSDLMSSLNTHFMSTLGIPFGQRQSYCLAALQNKSVSIITLRRGSEIVPIELTYRCMKHSQRTTNRVYHYWDKLQRMELLLSQYNVHGLVLFITDNQEYLRDISGLTYGDFSMNQGRTVSHQHLSLPSPKKDYPELFIRGTYTVRWQYPDGTPLKQPVKPGKYFYLLTEPNLK